MTRRVVAVVFLSAVTGALLIAFAFGILPIGDLSARPADAYDSAAELAQAHNAGGFE